MWRHALAGAARIGSPRPGVDGEPGLSARASGYAPSLAALRWAERPRQGALGNCWLMAPILAIHEAAPEYFRTSIDLGPRTHGSPADGSPAPDSPAHGSPTRDTPAEGSRALVRLYRRGEPTWVPVTRRFPVRADGRWAYATESTGEPGWAGLVEKALATQIAGSYAGIARGFAAFGFPALTGIGARTHLRLPSAARIEEWLGHGRAVVASTHPLSPVLSRRDSRRGTGRIVEVPSTHVMAVIGADPASGSILLRNPWKPGEVIEYSAREFRRYFLSADVTNAPVRSAAR